MSKLPSVLVSMLIALAGFTVAGAQQAGRPRSVPTRPPEPCNARDFVQANDTGINSVCSYLTLTWKDLNTGVAQVIRVADSDTTTLLDSDRGKVVNVTFAGGAEIDIAQAGTAGSFAAGWYVDIKCSGATGCEIDPTTSTIEGAASLSLTNGQTVRVVSDGTNYKTTLGGGGSGGISGLTPNTIPKANGSGTGLIDSQITDDGTDVTVTPGSQLLIGPAGSLAIFSLGNNDINLNPPNGTTVTNGLTVDTLNGAPVVTNSAGANVLPKSDGSVLVASDIVDTANTSIVATMFDAGVNTNVLTFTPDFLDMTRDTIQVFNVSQLTFAVRGDIVPTTTGLTTSVGLSTNPFSGLVIGSNASANVRLSPSVTGLRNVGMVDASGTLAIITNTVSLTGQAASIGSTNLQVNAGVAPAGLYRLSYYLVITTAGTSGTVSATFGWTDPAAARTSGTGNVTFGTLAAPATGSVTIRANGVANITYLTTVTAAVGSPAYALYVTLERLQ